MIPITGHTQLTALLGSPVAHSISPLMHNEAFHLLDLDYTYLCFDVNEENLETAVIAAAASNDTLFLYITFFFFFILAPLS